MFQIYLKIDEWDPFCSNHRALWFCMISQQSWLLLLTLRKKPPTTPLSPPMVRPPIGPPPGWVPDTDSGTPSILLAQRVALSGPTPSCKTKPCSSFEPWTLGLVLTEDRWEKESVWPSSAPERAKLIQQQGFLCLFGIFFNWEHNIFYPQLYFCTGLPCFSSLDHPPTRSHPKSGAILFLKSS